MSEGMNVRRQLLIAVLGPAVVGALVFFGVRYFSVEPASFDWTPQDAEEKELPEPAALDKTLDEIFSGDPPPRFAPQLTASVPSLEEMAAVLRAADPWPRSGVSGLAEAPAPTLYLLRGDDVFLVETSDSTLHRLTVPEKAVDADEDEKEGAALLRELDPVEEGIHVPCAVVFCSPPLLHRNEAFVGDAGPSTRDIVAAAKASERGALAAAVLGLTAVSRNTIDRRALEKRLQLPVGRHVLEVLILSRGASEAEELQDPKPAATQAE